MDDNNFVTTIQETFKGEIEEPVDKIYFRRRDEHSQYAECLFKSKVSINSNHFFLVCDKQKMNYHLLIPKQITQLFCNLIIILNFKRSYQDMEEEAHYEKVFSGILIHIHRCETL